MGSMVKLLLSVIIALFILCELAGRSQAFRVLEVHGLIKVLALENESVPIVCKTGEPMAYCGFVHPTGKRLSVSGHTLIDGKCMVHIKATLNDTGIWKCHIGRTVIGEEIEKTIEVRISGQLTAILKNITVTQGKDVTLTCLTTRDKIPLRYCRFEPPKGVPFSIDSDVRASKPILDRYYYPRNMSVDRGDCAVTISKVKYKDAGDWTCGVGLDDGQEYTDVITVKVEGMYSISKAASSNGIVLICVAIISILIILGIVAWKRRRFLGARRQPQPQVIEIRDLGPRLPSPGQRSPRSLTPARVIPSVVVQSPSSKGVSLSPM